MTDPTNDIDELLFLLQDHPCYARHHAALTALVAERDALQAKINAHAEDRRRYIDAWEGWIASTKRLGIAEWLRVYADAVPIPSLNGDEAKERVFKHLDQRMRDAAETIDELRKRIEELEAHPPADRDRDLREQMSAMMSWMTHVTDMIVIHGLNADHAKIELSRRIDRAIVAANKHGGGA